MFLTQLEVGPDSRICRVRSYISCLVNNALVVIRDTQRGCVDDPMTRQVLEKILAQEEAHAENLGRSLEELSVKARDQVMTVRGDSYARHRVQKEDIWSANVVGGYW